MKDSQIKLFFHCKKCCEENHSRKESMKEYSKISVGWTEKGLQAWCDRHNCNILNLDFKGQKVNYAE